MAGTQAKLVDEVTPSPELFQLLEKFLSAGQVEEALQELKRDAYESLLFDKGIDIVPIVCRFLSVNAVKKCPQLAGGCQELLCELAARGNAKELLVALLESLENFQSEPQGVRALLSPLQMVLLKLLGKRGTSLIWTLDILLSHAYSLPMPNTQGLEGEELLLFDQDPRMLQIQTCLDDLSRFIQPFVQEVALDLPRAKAEAYPDRLKQQRKLLTFFLLRLLHRPLTFLDLTTNGGTAAKSGVRTIAETLVSYFPHLLADLYQLFEYSLEDNFTSAESNSSDPSKGVSVETVSSLSLATLFYLVLAENIGTKWLPSVYSHHYTVECCLPAISSVLEQQETSAIEKGIMLAEVVLSQLKQEELSYQMLDVPSFLRFAHSLVSVMLHCGVRTLRTRSLALLQRYLAVFEMRGRARLLRHLLGSIQHAGVQGLLVQSYKDQLNAILSSGSHPLPPWFIGAGLAEVLRLACPLPAGPETDLLEHSDRIFAALNLVRYLALRDMPAENLTGFWDHVPWLEEQMLAPLRKGLDLSRAHYQLELKVLQMGNQNQQTLAPAQQQQVMVSALNAFDMMDSVLGRISEILHQVKLPNSVDDQ